jgi:hypothetical protein
VLEADLTILFTDTCEPFAAPGGPFAAVNEVVNRCAVPPEAVDVTGVEAAWLDKILDTAAYATEVEPASVLVCTVPAELSTGALEAGVCSEAATVAS